MTDPRAYSGIGMMGGPMSANDDLAWIDPLSHLLRAAVAQRVPVIGHCLGGQLLAQALGARVRRTEVPEIGWIDVETTDADARQRWFGGELRFTPFQWHYDVFDLPSGVQALGAMAYGCVGMRPEPGVCRRRPAHRVPVPYRNDPGPGGNVVPHRRR